MARLLLLVLAIALPSLSAETCPFLNAATAAGVLGGPVQESYVPSRQTNGDGVCRFVRHQSTLTIEVATMADRLTEFKAYLARCESKSTPVTAVGNEAVACGQLIIGRVRDRAFVIALTSQEATVRDKAKLVAEQVAGFLF